MGVLEESGTKKIRVTNPRILEIEKKISLIIEAPVSIYYDDVRINKKGFYNNEKSSNDIYIPQNAAVLKGDELFALILTETLFSTGKQKPLSLYMKILYIGVMIFCGLALAGTVINSLLTKIAQIIGMFLFFIAFFDSGSSQSTQISDVDFRIMVPLGFIGLAAFYMFLLPEEHTWADKETVKKTGNKQALINALNFMKDSEPDKDKKLIIGKRIEIITTL
ncbi:MAG: hypothetical protein LBR69_04920 [Endomicrobium sp.]|nr:hypothetical protein [Endomicrobium sp.]